MNKNHGFISHDFKSYDFTSYDFKSYDLNHQTTPIVGCRRHLSASMSMTFLSSENASERLKRVYLTNLIL